MLNRKWLIAVPVGALVMFSLALAQDPGRGGQGGGPGAGPAGGPGGGPGPGGFDPAQWRERMNKMMQEQLGASDEEWKVLSPKIEKVQTAQRDSFGGFGMMGFGRRGGPGGPPGGPGGPGAGNQPQSKIAQAQTDLRSMLDKKDAGAPEIASKLTAYREAREKARKEVQESQKILKDLVTQRQEAVLVLMGVLE